MPILYNLWYSRANFEVKAFRGCSNISKQSNRVTRASEISGRPMQSCPDPRHWLAVTNAEHAVLRLDRVPGAPAGDERPRERGVEEIDRHGVIQHAAHARWGDRPPVVTAILVEPCRDVGMPLAETARRNPEPDADRKAPLGHGDHLSRVARHLCSSLFVLI